MLSIKTFFESVRKPQRNIPLSGLISTTVGIILLGFLLGVLQKWLDSTASNHLPEVLQQLDFRNYFGRLAIWMLLGTVLSVYSPTPLWAAIHTFCFFISMLAGYYLYCNYVLGFLPRRYMQMWIVISCFSFLMAYVCWYAKGKGIAAVFLSSLILGCLLAQAVNLGRGGVYVYHFLEVLTWFAGVILLRRKPKEFAMELGLSIAVAFVYQLVIPHWG